MKRFKQWRRLEDDSRSLFSMNTENDDGRMRPPHSIGPHFLTAHNAVLRMSVNGFDGDVLDPRRASQAHHRKTV